MIDLRSDTVTMPTAEMRAAMAQAELGDDVYGEDPTVNRLEELAAAAMGKEAALLVPSGTMGNLIALLTHCPRGTKALLGSQSHTYVYEAGGGAAVGGIMLAAVANREGGELDLIELERELSLPDDPHFARARLIALENTHNRCGGEAVAPEHMAQVAGMARQRGLAVHLDGARIFNAAVALGTTAASLASQADSVLFCLSKGLACPVGSLLCASGSFIAEARRVRKTLGGGMRQAGIVAAAGIVALGGTMVERLAEDHDNARALADGLAGVGGLRVLPARRRTNMVFFEVADGSEKVRRFLAALREHGVLVTERSATVFRAVTHYGIDRNDIGRALEGFRRAAAEVNLS